MKAASKRAAKKAAKEQAAKLQAKEQAAKLQAKERAVDEEVAHTLRCALGPLSEWAKSKRKQAVPEAEVQEQLAEREKVIRHKYSSSQHRDHCRFCVEVEEAERRAAQVSEEKKREVWQLLPEHLRIRSSADGWLLKDTTSPKDVATALLARANVGMAPRVAVAVTFAEKRFSTPPPPVLI